MDWLLNRMLRAPDPDGGGSNGNGDGANNDGGDGGGKASGGDGGDGGGSQQGDDGKGGDAKVDLTQGQVDDLVTGRSKRAGTAALAAAAKGAGFDSIEDMTAAAKAAKEREDEDKSELERAKDALKDAEDRAKGVADDLEASQVANAFQAAAMAAKVPPDRLSDALALADLSDIKVEDGVVSGADEAVKTLVEAKPWVVGSSNDSGGGGAGGANGGARGTGAGAGSVDPDVVAMGAKMGLHDSEAVAQAAAVTDRTANAKYVEEVKDRIAARRAEARKARSQ